MNENLVRIVFYIGVLGLMMLWERFSPRRLLTLNRNLRWPSNLGIAALNSLLVKLIMPITAFGLALEMQRRGLGILNYLKLAKPASFLIGFLILDLTIYFQHRLFHRVDWLWRLHRMHHTDQDFDVTTGARFHPLEILISMIIKLFTVVLLGPLPSTVLVFEVVLNATSVFNHSNVRIPLKVDQWLRWMIVTPDMHRIHHSVEHDEMNRNFGFNLPWWDRLWGTYRSRPSLSHESMAIGLIEFRKSSDQRLDQMLVQPFLNRDRR